MLIQLQKDKFIELINTIENYNLAEVKKRQEKIEVFAYSYKYSFVLKRITFVVVSERDPEILYSLIHKKVKAKTIEVPGVGMRSPKDFIENEYDIKLEEI